MIAKIMDLVPIKDVFVDMRVSKKWEEWCREAVRTRKSLIIGNNGRFCFFSQQSDYDRMRGWDKHRNPPSPKLDKIIVINDWLVPMMKSVERMTNVRQLCVSKISPHNVREFIRKLADQLTLLKVDSAIGDISADIVFPRLTHLHCRHFDAETASAFPKLTELIIEESMELPDMKLPSLKRLRFVSCSAGEPNQLAIRQFILSNCDNLEFLDADFFDLGSVGPVVFKNLTVLEIQGIRDEDVVRSLPAIRCLNLMDEQTQEPTTTVAVLGGLPAAQMLSLSLLLEFDHVADQDEDDGGEDEEEGMHQFVEVISRMTNLKELRLDAGYENLLTDPTQALRSIIDKLHQLEKIFIYFRPCEFNMDSVISLLVQRNPNLRDVSFADADFTSAASASLAQLQHLSHIAVFHDSEKKRVSNSEINPVQMMTDNVLTLLRGSSRSVIRELSVWKKIVNIAQLTAEIDLMAEERGSTFKKFDHHVWSTFEINV